MKYRNIFIIICGLTVFLVLFFVYLRNKKLKRKLERKQLLQELHLIKSQYNFELRKKAIEGISKREKLNKELIETNIKAQLNSTDWNILNSLYNNPQISNIDISSKISLSIHGVRSSLKKMYTLFNINKSVRDQRILLVIEAINLSKKS